MLKPNKEQQQVGTISTNLYFIKFQTNLRETETDSDVDIGIENNESKSVANDKGLMNVICEL